MIEPITADDMARAFTRWMFNHPPKEVRPTVILAQVATRHGMTPDNIRSRVRDKKTYTARHEVMLRLREETDMTLMEIGRFVRASDLPPLDHTTVMSGIERAKQRRDNQ